MLSKLTRQVHGMSAITILNLIYTNVVSYKLDFLMVKSVTR